MFSKVTSGLYLVVIVIGIISALSHGFEWWTASKVMGDLLKFLVVFLRVRNPQCAVCLIRADGDLAPALLSPQETR